MVFTKTKSFIAFENYKASVFILEMPPEGTLKV